MRRITIEAPGIAVPCAIHSFLMTAAFLAAFATVAQAAIPLHGFKGDMASTSDKFVALDINGDGKTDFLYYRPGSGYAGVYISQGDGSLRYVEYSRPGTQSNGFVGDVSNSADTAIALDINGDGKTDFLWYRPGSGYAGVYLSNGDGTLQYVEYSRPGKQSNGFVGDVNSSADTAIALDINGDGKTDFLWYRPGSGYAGVYLSKGDGTVQYLEYSHPGTQSNGFVNDVMSALDTAVALDINGDGKTDFLWYRPGSGYAGVYIAYPDGSGKVTYVEYSRPGTQSNGFTGDVTSVADRAVALDINGDGRSDFLWYRPGAGFAGVYLSRGNGTLLYVDYSGQSNGFVGDVMSTADTAVALDINGDGKTDFLWYRPGSGYAGVYIANADGSGRVTYTEYSNPNGQSNGFRFDVMSAQDTALALNLQGKKSSDFLWLRPGGGYAGACLSTGAAAPQCISYEGSTATWMGDMADQIGKVPLKGIAMPGTHDSAMYSGMPDVDYSKNQEEDFTGQLTAGARWFDFRMGYYTKQVPNIDLYAQYMDGTVMSCDDWNKPTQPGFYMYGHSNICTSIYVADALNQIKTFLDTHPREIVFLDIAAWVGAAQTNNLAQLLEDSLAPYIYRSNCAQTGGACSGVTPPEVVTPEDLWRTNQRVVLLLDDSNDCGVTDEMWPKSMVASVAGYNGSTNGIGGDTGYEISFMESGMNTLRPAWSSFDSQPKMLELLAALTPLGAKGGSGCGAHCLDAPIALAEWFNPVLVATIQGNWNSRSLNAFGVDYISCCGVAEAIINFNDQQWIPMSVGATDIAAGKDGSVWKIDSNGPGPDYGISYLNGSGWYTAQNKKAVRIAVDPTGLPWVVDSGGMIWHLTASTLSSMQSGNGGDFWQSLPGSAKDIGIGADGSVWVLGSTNSLYRFNGSTWDLLPGDGAGHRIAVDNSGKPVVVAMDDYGIFRYDGQNWIRYANGDFTKALDVGTGADGSLWVAGIDAQSVGGVWKWTGSGWNRLRGDGTAVAADPTGSPWVVTSAGGLRVGKLH